jgi:Putative restriction endonuclease
MSMVVAIRRFTPEEYLALPDRDRFELVEGRLVEVPMSMLSSWVGSQVNRILGDFVVRNDLGWVFMADNLYRCFSDPDNPLSAHLGLIIFEFATSCPVTL